MRWVFVILLVGLLLANGAPVRDHSEILNARYEHVKCKVDFTTSALQAVVEAVPETSASLSPHLSALQNDLSQLDSLADAGNVTNFNSYVPTINGHVRDAHQALQGERANYRSYNVTRETLASLRQEFNASRQEFVRCEQDAALELGRARAEQFRETLEHWRDAAEHLEEKGVDVSGMNAVISEADTAIVAPLETAVNSGDGEAALAALKQYCLGNSCRNGTNGHYYAKFNVARLKAILAKVESDPRAANYTSLLDEVNGEISAAEATVNQAGTAHYTEEQKTSVWSNIREAAQGLRELVGLIRRAGRPGI